LAQDLRRAPSPAMSFSAFFDGDIYADDEPVCRGIGLSSQPLAGAFRDFPADPWAFEKPPPPPLSLERVPTTPTTCASASGDEDAVLQQVRAGRPTVTAVGSPEQLRSRLVELLQLEGEALVRLSEKPGVWKARVELFSDERQETLTVGLRVIASGSRAVAEFARHRGDALLFHALFREAKRQVEGVPLAEPPTATAPALVDPSGLATLVALAEAQPEEAVAMLARELDRLDAAGLAAVEVDVARWLASPEVGVVGAACAVAARVQAPVRTLALEQAAERLQRSDTLAGRLLLRLVLALPADGALPTGALRDAGAGLDAETRGYITAICA